MKIVKKIQKVGGILVLVYWTINQLIPLFFIYISQQYFGFLIF